MPKLLMITVHLAHQGVVSAQALLDVGAEIELEGSVAGARPGAVIPLVGPAGEVEPHVVAGDLQETGARLPVLKLAG